MEMREDEDREQGRCEGRLPCFPARVAVGGRVCSQPKGTKSWEKAGETGCGKRYQPDRCANGG